MVYRVKFREGQVVRFRDPKNPNNPDNGRALVILSVNPYPSIYPAEHYLALIAASGDETIVFSDEIRLSN